MTETWYAHPTAVIDDGARIGPGTKIWHFCHVMGSAVVGPDCSLGQNVFVGPNVTVGRNAKIQNNVSLYDGVHLEDDVFCGPSMVFTNVLNPRSHVSRKDEFRRTFVRQGATLGANCTIVCGTEIGRFGFVAAGAVVTRDVPPYALMMGMPARRVGWMCACGIRLDLPASGDAAAECDACGARYLLSGETLERRENDT